MSSLALTAPGRPAGGAARQRLPRSLADILVVEFASAEDVASGIRRLGGLLRDVAGVDRVEWWAPAQNGAALSLEAAEGSASGPRTAVALGPVGALVLVGAGWPPRLLEALTRLVPLLRRRWTEERLAGHATLLARRAEALEDFAALVAHELKRPLQDALLGGDPAAAAERALELVDSVLEAVRSERPCEVHACPAACLRDALQDLGGVEAEVAATLPDAVPMPAAALRIVLRNLVANAEAAGARHVRVSAVATATHWTLVVDDDGAGLEAADRYAAGSRLGLGLCSRLVARLGGALELRPRASGGTRARLVLART